MNFTIEMHLEEDGRHIADIPELPGCMALDEIKEQAIRNAIALALEVYAGKIRHNEEEEEIDLKTKNFFLDFTLVSEPVLVEAC